LGRFGPWRTRFSENTGTAPAFQVWTALLHREQRNEKEGQVVIHPLQLGLIEAALWTNPCGSVKLDRLGLNAGNEKEHGLPFSHHRLSLFVESLAFSFLLSIGNCFKENGNCGM
jgi:hypothetical protein